MFKYQSNNGCITIDHNTPTGDVEITVQSNEGTNSSLLLDNYQTYKLALALLNRVDVVDTRGSN